VRDVHLGAKYYVGDELLRCLVSGGVLAKPEGPVPSVTLPNLAENGRPWADLWAICQDDAKYYRQQRQPA